LAAANPIGGRYDKSKSLRSNINLGAPILSRFDLFFILIDEANEVTDYAIARKIVDLHANMEESIDRVYSREEILLYITFARQFQPKLTTVSIDYYDFSNIFFGLYIDVALLTFSSTNFRKQLNY